MKSKRAAQCVHSDLLITVRCIKYPNVSGELQSCTQLLEQKSTNSKKKCFVFSVRSKEPYGTKVIHNAHIIYEFK